MASNEDESQPIDREAAASIWLQDEQINVIDVEFHNKHQRPRRSDFVGNTISSVTTLAGMSQAQFNLDGRSALKVRLAPLSPPDQIAWLIQDLSKKKYITEDESAEIQLAGDLGPAAGQSAAAKLWDMDQRRDKYSGAGFSVLFSVITMSGDDEKNIWDHFKNDANPLIAEYAKRGGGGQFIEAY